MAASASAPAQAYQDSYLYRLRHSAAHLLAQAVQELYPGAKLSIGPAIENGFYYDIEFPTPLREEDLLITALQVRSGDSQRATFAVNLSQ